MLQRSVWYWLFYRRYVTMDEIRLHLNLYTPEFRKRSTEWTAIDEPDPKRAKTQLSAGNEMTYLYIVWDANGIIYINNLLKVISINSGYNCVLLDLFFLLILRTYE